MKTWRAIALGTAVCVPVLGQTHARTQSPQRFPISAQLVAQAISGTGVPVQESQVSLLANVVSSVPDPALEIREAETFADHANGQSRVKLACTQPGVCVPFYVVVSLPSSAASGKPLEQAMTAPPPQLKSSGAVTMRAGTHARLLIDDGRMHIEISVIALESGAVGHRIRVASPDHKQFYEAEVVSANVLKGSV